MDSQQGLQLCDKIDSVETLHGGSPANWGQHGPNHPGSNDSWKAQLQVARGENQRSAPNLMETRHGERTQIQPLGARTGGPGCEQDVCNRRLTNTGDQQQKTAARKTKIERRDGQGDHETRGSMFACGEPRAAQTKNEPRPPVQSTVPS